MQIWFYCSTPEEIVLLSGIGYEVSGTTCRIDGDS